MSTPIESYVNNNLCCLAAQMRKTDEKLKYGIEDARCCINRDFMASVFLDLLACNTETGVTWYSAIMHLEFVQDVPPVLVFPTTVVMTDDAYLTSSDGTMTVIIPLSGSYPSIDLADFNRQIHAVILDAYNAIDDFTATMTLDPITGAATYLLEFSEIWGTPDGVWTAGSTGNAEEPVNGLASGGFTGETVVNSSSACLTEKEACELKNWLDEYCHSCGEGNSVIEIGSSGKSTVQKPTSIDTDTTATNSVSSIAAARDAARNATTKS